MASIMQFPAGQHIPTTEVSLGREPVNLVKETDRKRFSPSKPLNKTLPREAYFRRSWRVRWPEFGRQSVSQVCSFASNLVGKPHPSALTGVIQQSRTSSITQPCALHDISLANSTALQLALGKQQQKLPVHQSSSASKLGSECHNASHQRLVYYPTDFVRIPIPPAGVNTGNRPEIASLFR